MRTCARARIRNAYKAPAHAREARPSARARTRIQRTRTRTRNCVSIKTVLMRLCVR